jgi:hypothetical protein
MFRDFLSRVDKLEISTAVFAGGLAAGGAATLVAETDASTFNAGRKWVSGVASISASDVLLAQGRESAVTFKDPCSAQCPLLTRLTVFRAPPSMAATNRNGRWPAEPLRGRNSPEPDIPNSETLGLIGVDFGVTPSRRASWCVLSF